MPRSVASQDTARRIRDAADELFSTSGYHGVSVGDIAAAAGVQKALVFYHFGSKAELFEHILERYYEAHRAALAGVFGDAGPARPRLHRLVDAYLDFITRNQRYAALVQKQVSDPETHPVIRRHFEPLFRWIEQALLEVTPAAGPLAARQFFITFSGLVINYFTYTPLLAELWGEDPLSVRALDERRQHLHWLVDQLLDGLEAEAAAREGPGAGRGRRRSGEVEQRRRVESNIPRPDLPVPAPGPQSE